MAGTLEETVDLYWIEEPLPEMPEVSGRAALVQRLVRRCNTPTGYFPWWRNEGVNVPDFVLSKISPWRIRTLVEEQCSRDEQVEQAIARVDPLESGKFLRVTVAIRDARGEFAFTMNITEAAATLVDLEGEG